MERLGKLPQVEDDDTDTDPEIPRLKSIKIFKHAAAQATKSAPQTAAEPNDSFLQQYAQALKRKRDQDDGPKKRVTNVFSPAGLIEDVGSQDTYLDQDDEDDSSDPEDSDESYTDNYGHRETSVSAFDAGHPREYPERHNRRVKHWRSWCHRKRYPNDVVTAEKYSTYIKESLAPRTHRDRHNPHLEILPIRTGATDSDEGEIPAWETVVEYISAVRSLYQEQCESVGVRPDIDGIMATPETAAIISQFRSSQSMPQFVQAPSYQPKLKTALRYLWMKGYREQECGYSNQWCGTRTRLCLAFDRFKGPQHELRRNLLTALYPAYYMDYATPKSVFAVAIARANSIGQSQNTPTPTYTRLFRHTDVEICPVGCLAMYLLALWMDDGLQPNFRDHEWQSFYLLQPSDSSKLLSEKTYKRYVGVALGMAETGAATQDNTGGIYGTDNIVGTDTPLTPSSVTDIPTNEPYKLTAHLHLNGEYSVLRDAIVPPLELQRQIFPFIEKLFPFNDDWRTWIDNIMMNRPEDTYRCKNWRAHYSKEYLAAIRLMLVLAHLRKIVLQDVVAMKICARDMFGVHDYRHRIANSPVFSSQEVYRFEQQLRVAMHERRSAKGGNLANPQPSFTTALDDSSSVQLPTPTEDDEADTTLVDRQSPEPAPTSQPSMASPHQHNISQLLPQELRGILPTEDDDADILEIKKSLASMFRYMETESKAVGHFASATFASLDQLQGQMTSVEKTVQTLLAREDATESRSSEQTRLESKLRLLASQQEPRNLEQWLQEQNEIRPWTKDSQRGTGSQRSTVLQVVGEDSEAQTEGVFNMDAFKEKMLRTKALNFDVKRRISKLEKDLVAVGQSLRAVAGRGRDVEERAEVETEAEDEERGYEEQDVSGEEESGKDQENVSGEEEEEQDGQELESWGGQEEPRNRSRTVPRQYNQYTSWVDPHRQIYPEDLLELAGRIAAVYPQLQADKVRDENVMNVSSTQLTLRAPTTVKDVWEEWFSAQGGSKPSIWSLDEYFKGWRSGLRGKDKLTVYKKRVIVVAILREIGNDAGGSGGGSLKRRVAEVLEALQHGSAKGSLYGFCNRHDSNGHRRAHLRRH